MHGRDRTAATHGQPRLRRTIRVSATDADVPSPNPSVDGSAPAAVSAGLAAGNAALARGEWEAAYKTFESVVQMDARPDALEGLGLAAWWLDLADVVFDARERSYRGYRERGDSLSAARVAVW